jgi:hypothetical protein
LLVYLITTTWELNDPESIVAVPYKVPTKLHSYPVAAPLVELAAGKAGAI